MHAVVAGLFFFLEFAALKQHGRLFLGGFWMFILCFNSQECVLVCRPHVICRKRSEMHKYK